MKTLAPRMIPPFIFALFIPFVSVAQQQSLTGAVLEFEASDREMEANAGEVSILLGALLSGSENIQLVERVSLQKILEEQEMGLFGTQEPDSITKVGKLLGAQVLITGRIFKMGETFYLSSKTIGTESGRVFGHTVKFSSLNQLDSGVEVLAKEIDVGLKDQMEKLVPQVESPEAFAEKLAALVPDGDKPTVSISIPESHLTRQIPDPAVETEVKKQLLALGYTVLTGPDSAKADLRIQGEAFSEFAARFGRLVACRARLEVEVVNPKTGNVLMTDGIMVSNADVAENVAAKGALHKSARELLPAVVKSLSL
ncbi:MAG: hypothetical protein PF795_03915 [Kiritimatiellae bacterium]|jgi:hypothetical protein|nr:hypothetical protein [Kiritimatiellia bacterium]